MMMTPLSRFFCGAVAGATAQTLIYPLEVVKTRLAVSTMERTAVSVTHFSKYLDRRVHLR